MTSLLLSLFVCSNTYLYLSLPVFSHWQGRLDPRVMILGGTRRGKVGTGGARGPGRGRHGGGHPHHPGAGDTLHLLLMVKDQARARKEIQIMKVDIIHKKLILVSYLYS